MKRVTCMNDVGVVAPNVGDHEYVVVLVCLNCSDDKVSDLWESAEFVECFHLVSDVV